MKLQDEKRSTSRAAISRDLSRGPLAREPSRGSISGVDLKIQETQIENLSKEKSQLEKRVKELELDKIRLERSKDAVETERDQLKIQIGYLQNSTGPSAGAKLDIMVENKEYKQKLYELKQDYETLLSENL